MTLHAPDTSLPPSCLERLSRQRVGRLVYTRAALPAVVALTYRLQDDHLILLPAPGADWPSRVAGTVVAFEVDEIDADHGLVWSIVITGYVVETPEGLALDYNTSLVTGAGQATC